MIMWHNWNIASPTDLHTMLTSLTNGDKVANNEGHQVRTHLHTHIILILQQVCRECHCFQLQKKQTNKKQMFFDAYGKNKCILMHIYATCELT